LIRVGAFVSSVTSVTWALGRLYAARTTGVAGPD